MEALSFWDWASFPRSRRLPNDLGSLKWCELALLLVENPVNTDVAFQFSCGDLVEGIPHYVRPFSVPRCDVP